MKLYFDGGDRMELGGCGGGAEDKNKRTFGSYNIPDRSRISVI